MSVGPLTGLAASLAGSPLAQTKGSEVERAQHGSSEQVSRVQNEGRAENAAGIGETDGENHETSERDADGRRAWELAAHKSADSTQQVAVRQSKDNSGNCGSLLDLTG